MKHFKSTARELYTQAYRIARTNRKSPLWFNEAFSFPGGRVQITDRKVSVVRTGTYPSLSTAFWLDMLCGGMGSAAGERYVLDNLKGLPPLPLP